MCAELVSVVIPSYNRAYCIADSVGSVLDQTYNNLEVIVVDDGSSDNTEEVVTSIDDDRVRYVRQNNAGACVARNHGVDLAKGSIVAFHDSDDLWLPQKLERQLHTLQTSGADFCYCRIQTFIEDPNTGSRELVHVMPGEDATADDLTFERLIERNFISTQVLVGHRDVFVEERFDPRMPRLQDWDIVLRLFRRFVPAFEPEVLVSQIIRSDSLSSNVQKFCQGLELLEQKNEDYLLQHKDVYATMLLNAAMSLAGESYEDSKRLYLKSFGLQKNPLALAHLVHTRLMWVNRPKDLPQKKR